MNKIAVDVACRQYEKKLKNVQTQRPERRYLDEVIQWKGASRLIYLALLESVHRESEGYLDMGIIWLCFRWVQLHRVAVIDEKTCLQMLFSILPSDLYEKLTGTLVEKRVLKKEDIVIC